MWRLILILSALMSAPVAWGFPSYKPGEGFHVLEPTKLTLEGYYVKNNRDDYLQYSDAGSDKYALVSGTETWRDGAAVRFNLDLVSMDDWGLYWNNNVHMASTDRQVRQVGWEYETGVHAGTSLDFFWYHHSQHVLDAERDPGHYPLVNMYGVRLVFIEEGRK